jgi:hypothetical protein
MTVCLWYFCITWAHGDAVGWGTALQIRQLQVRSVRGVWNFIDIPLAALWSWGLHSLLIEMITRNISFGLKVASAYFWSLTTFMWQLSWNVWSSTSWNPQGLSRPVRKLLYHFLILHRYISRDIIIYNCTPIDRSCTRVFKKCIGKVCNTWT